MTKALISTIVLTLSIYSNSFAQENENNTSSMFIDPNDAYLDMSKFLTSKKGFMPIPILITGPTFGLGGGLNIMFLHDKLMAKAIAPMLD